MMKKRFLLFIAILCMAFGFVGCEEKHTHSYTDVVTAPTCTEKGYTTHTCSCGDVVVDTYVDELGHKWGEYISDENATSEDGGTKTATCTRSGCEEMDTVTDAGTKLDPTTIFYYQGTTITGLKEYGKTLSSIVIPNKINGERITCIGLEAFMNCMDLKSVVMSDNITEICAYAFWSCGNLTRVKMSNNVTIIGQCAFSGCGNLTEIVIPDKVTTIGSSAFSGCGNLTEIVIPDGVTYIEFKTFYACSSLTKIVIPDSVTIIDAEAFFRCAGLTELVIGKNVSKIGNQAFSECTGLENVTIPRSVSVIGTATFYGCSSLERFTVDSNNMAYQSIDGNLYSKDGKTLVQYAIGKTATSFAVPDSVTSIGSYAFENCTNLTSVVIGNSVTTIGNYAFRNCDHLTSITFNGTKAEWNAIQKGSNWYAGVPATVVHCTDGDAAL